MASSRFAAVFDAVLAACQAEPTLAATTISDTLPLTQDRLTALLMIGNSGDPEDPRAGSIRQSYHDMAGTSSTRDETVTINCAVMVQTGDIDVAATRSSAFTVLAGVESALRGSIGLGLSYVMRVEVIDAEVYIEQFADGTSVRIPFTIEATCLI